MSAGYERLAVHHEEPHVALVGVGQDLLCDDVAVATDRLDHLVEVGRLVARHEEHAAAPGALQRLEHGLPAHGVDELGDLGGLPGDEGAGPDRFGEVLEVRLVDGVGEVARVVHDERAPAHRELAEEDAGRHRPRALDGVVGGVVAHHEHVEVVDADRLVRLVGLHDLEVGAPGPCASRPFAVRAWAATEPSGRWLKSSTPMSHASCPRRVAASASAGGRVLGRLGGDAVDDEADLHAAVSVSSASDGSRVGRRVGPASPGHRGSAGRSRASRSSPRRWRSATRGAADRGILPSQRTSRSAPRAEVVDQLAQTAEVHGVLREPAGPEHPHGDRERLAVGDATRRRGWRARRRTAAPLHHRVDRDDAAGELAKPARREPADEVLREHRQALLGLVVAGEAGRRARAAAGAAPLTWVTTCVPTSWCSSASNRPTGTRHVGATSTSPLETITPVLPSRTSTCDSRSGAKAR